MSSQHYFDIKLVFEPRDSRIVKLNKIITPENFLFLIFSCSPVLRFDLVLFSCKELFFTNEY